MDRVVRLPCLEVRLATCEAEPVRVGEVTVVPEARMLSVALPFGLLIWNRPVAVRVERGGRAERLPIADPTGVARRAGLAGLAALAALAALGGAALPRRRQR